MSALQEDWDLILCCEEQEPNAISPSPHVRGSAEVGREYHRPQVIIGSPCMSGLSVHRGGRCLEVLRTVLLAMDVPEWETS